MMLGSKKAALLLAGGDIIAFGVSLWLTLFIRTGAVPTGEILAQHVPSFALLFALWILIFFMAGLYGKRVALFPSRLPDTLLRTQFLNIVLAALFFFIAPVGIAPKTVLALYLFVSLIAIYLWRLVFFPKLAYPRSRLAVALVGSGSEAEELVHEVNSNPHYPFTVALTLTPGDPKLAEVARRYQLVELSDMYEEVFDRVPLSLLAEDWFTKHAVVHTPLLYAVAKRLIDILGGVLMGLITIVATPFVALALRLEGPGPVFIRQDRIGRHERMMRAYKFRTMRQNKSASSEWTVEEKKDNPVTKVGNFLRMTSLDEFPQFINILKGEISLIGPRNDVEGLGKRLAEALPYYNARYLVAPGITGWAQINQQYEQNNISPQSIAETKVRLAYDFYYLKHRSLGLDIVIALKTVKRMLFRVSTW